MDVTTNNYSNLSQFLNDLKYLMKTGGNPFTQNNEGVNITKINTWIIEGLKFIVLAIIIYWIIIFAFKGYPRTLLNILTLSFNKKQPLQKLILDKNFLLNNIINLQNNETSSKNAFNTIELLFNISNLKTTAKNLDNIINLYYYEYKYEDKFKEAFVEYYLYHNYVVNEPVMEKVIKFNILNYYNYINNFKQPAKNIDPLYKEFSTWMGYQLCVPNFKIPLNPNIKTTINEPSQTMTDNSNTKIRDINTVSIDVNNNKQSPAPIINIPVKLINFYNFVVQYYKNTGKFNYEELKDIDGYNKNDEQLALMLFFKDNCNLAPTNRKNVKKNIKQRVFDTHLQIKDLSKICKDLTNLLNLYPITYYLILPDSQQAIFRFSNDFVKYQKFILNKVEENSIYNDNFNNNKINEYSWYLFEIIYSYLNPTSYNIFTKELLEYIPKNLINSELFNSFLNKYLNTPYALKSKSIKSVFLNFPELKNLNIKIFNYIDKHPIFTRIFLSTHTNKEILYRKIISTYISLINTDLTNGETMTKNLLNNGKEFFKIISSVNIIDLYFNTYQPDFTRLFEEQYISNEDFFKALHRPFIKQFWHGRVMEYYRRIFSKRNIDGTYQRFDRFWLNIGYMLKSAKSNIGGAFKRDIPKQTVEPPPQDKSTSGEEPPATQQK